MTARVAVKSRALRLGRSLRRSAEAFFVFNLPQPIKGAMANGNGELLRKMRDVIERGGNIDINTRDVLLFSAIIDIYDLNEKQAESIKELKKQIADSKEDQKDALQSIRDEYRPMKTFYAVGVWAASAIGMLFIGLLWGMLTGRVQLVFVQ